MDLLEQIREIDSRHPVVLYTRQEEEIAELIDAGATNYLQRTVKGASAAFVSLVSSVVENYHREQRKTIRYRSELEQQLAGLHETTKQLMDAQTAEELGEIVCAAIEDTGNLCRANRTVQTGG